MRMAAFSAASVSRASIDLLELPFRPVRQITLMHREYQIRQFASALVMRGRKASALTSLADVVVIDAFKDRLLYLLDAGTDGRHPRSCISRPR